MIQVTDKTPGRTVEIEGRNYLYFSGFSYLGMHVSPALQALVTAGLTRYGTVYPSSRISNLQLRLYEELEHALAALLQQQSAVTFSSGYLAAQAAITYAADKGELLYAPGTHPAIRYPGAQIPSGNVQAWLAAVTDLINLGNDDQYVIVCDAVNPLTATIHDFSALQQIRKKVLVLLDDSHGIGVLGKNGEGIVHVLPGSSALRYIITASLAKSFSLEGGVIAGHAADIAAIRHLPLFTASTPMIPAYAHAFLHAREAFQSARNTLVQNIHQFETLTKLVHPHPLPMFILPEGKENVYPYLLARDIVVSSFSYPDPQGPTVDRVVLSALHIQQDVHHLATHINTFYTST